MAQTRSEGQPLPKRLTTQGVLKHIRQPMYAVLKTGGKQYKVQAGDIIQIEKLENDQGASVEFKEILFACKPSENPEVLIGKPLLSGAVVKGEIVGQGRGDKILIIKYKRRKQYRRTKGHRQDLTQVLVTSINNGSGGTSELSAEQKKTALSKFQSYLTPRGGKVYASNEGASTSQKKSAAKKTPSTAAKAKKTPTKKTSSKAE